MLLLVGGACASEKPWHFMLEEAGSTWKERWENMALKAPEMSSEERIKFFSHILVTNSSDVREPNRETYKKVQNILLNTPGHAEHFGRQLVKTPHHPDRNRWFQYMQNLPSPETVRVLGSFLHDEGGRPELLPDGSNVGEIMDSRPLCDSAAKALNHLLENPPNEKGKYKYPTDLEIWRLWWERVEAGNQTFRFMGDDTHYTLRGPSKRGAIEPGPRNTKRNSSPHSKDVAGTRPPVVATQIFPYLVGGIFLLAGVIYFLSSKRQRT